jgi:serine/threonine-protein kinase HipA
LSPAYDVNPVYFGTGLTLNISESDNALDFELALSAAPYFRVQKKKAEEILETVRKARGQWHKLAKELGIPRSEQELMESAFTDG